MKKPDLNLNGGKPVTSLHEAMGGTVAPAASLAVPLILIFSFLHSLTLFLAVLVSFLAVPFLVYAIAERHWPILIASAVVLLITGSVAANALGIL